MRFITLSLGIAWLGAAASFPVPRLGAQRHPVKPVELAKV